MELVRSCAIVFMIATSQLVGAYPHGYGGYGIKSGAAAKAQAGAVAGAFTGAGHFPIAFPPGGAGFSGSYSKSSSSSFAASSASSSAYSFSGAGTIGGCGTGLCPNGGVSNGVISPENNLNGFHTNNANGAAAAQAGSVAGSKDNGPSSCSGYNCNQKGADCNGPNCNGFPTSGNKCESGHCEPTSPASNDHTTNEPNKCAYGQCEAGSTSNAQPSRLPNGNNNLNRGDIDNDKCTSGDCKTTGTGSSLPNHSSPDHGKPGQDRPAFGQNFGVPQNYESNNHPSKCTSGQCGPTSTKDNSSPNKCTSGQCNPTDKFPSTTSDDIPINFSGDSSSTSNYGSNQQTHDKSSPNCVSGNCESLPSSQPTSQFPHSSENTYPKPNYSHQNKDTPICNSPECNNDAYNPHASASVGASSPVFNKPVQFLTAPKQEPSCTSPNCQSPGAGPHISGQYPSSSVNIGTNPSAGAVPDRTQYPASPTAPGAYASDAFNPKPACSNGKCGNAPSTPSGSSTLPPSKCTSSNCASNVPQKSPYNTAQSSSQTKSPSGIPNYNSQNIPHSSSASGSPPDSPQVSNPTFKPSLTGYGPITGPTSIAHNPETHPNKPSYSSNLPTTSNLPEPNNSNDDGSIPPFVPLRPSNSPNCDGNSCVGGPSIRPNNGQIQPTDGKFSYGTSSSPVPSSPSGSRPNYGPNSLPTYPGPDPHNSGVPSSTGPIYGQNPAPAHPNYVNSGQPISTGITSNSGSATSNAGAHASKPEKPYVGGFGGPTGLLKPNEFILSNNNALSSNSKPLSSGQSPASCSTGSCGNPQQGNSGIGVQTGAHGSVPCATGDCGSSTGPTGNFNLNGAHAVAGASASANAVAYSGGFGGPPGLLTPFDDGKLGNVVPGKSSAGLTNPQSASNGGQSTHNHLFGGAHAGSAAQAFAVAGASAGSTAGNPQGHGNNGHHGAGSGCSGGCGGNGLYGAGRSLDLQSSPNLSNGLHGGFSAAGAVAKAGAVGYGGHAGSFASAQASAGAAVKGGHYGR